MKAMLPLVFSLLLPLLGNAAEQAPDSCEQMIGEAVANYTNQEFNYIDTISHYDPKAVAVQDVEVLAHSGSQYALFSVVIDETCSVFSVTEK